MVHISPAGAPDPFRSADGSGRAIRGYRAGMILGDKYRLREQVGEGGMGAIWTADHLALCVEVAVKIIHPELTCTTASDRLLLEAHAAARLRHRSIVKVFDFGFSEFGDPYFVMERLHGGNLFDMLQREGALPQVYAVQLMLPIIEAIVAAHAQGIVHRDLKPENIMIVTDDAGCIVPKVLDFGVAKFAASPMGKPPITQGNTILGTPAYMSPEQARGEPDVDERADIWGLSMILFEMLAGRPPFTASNYLSVLISIIETPTPSLDGVDSELASLVSRGLHKDRAGRWGSAREFGVALADWLIHRGTFEDISTASVRARWNLDSWRPPSDRPVSEPPSALTIQLRPDVPTDHRDGGTHSLAKRAMGHFTPLKGHGATAALVGSFLLLLAVAVLTRGASEGFAPSIPVSVASTLATAVPAAIEKREMRQDRGMPCAPDSHESVDQPPAEATGSRHPETAVENAPRSAAKSQFVRTTPMTTPEPVRRVESEARRGGKVDFGF
jgi:serine/threonine protein kinase